MRAVPPDPRLPLSHSERLHSADVEEVRRVVADAFCPHELEPLDHAAGFDTRFHGAADGAVSLSYLDYGGRVRIRPYEQETFYLVLMPLKNGAVLRHGREQAWYRAGAAGIPPIDARYDIDVDADSPHLVVRVDAARVEERLAAALNRSVTKPVTFRMGMDASAPSTRAWHESVTHLLHRLDSDDELSTQPQLMRNLESYVVDTLLSQPHNYSEDLLAPARSTRDLKLTRRARALIEKYAAEERVMELVLRDLGISRRTLQENFKLHLDTSPGEYLWNVRLDRIRDDLAAGGSPPPTVAAATARWRVNYNHNFVDRYLARFGELPRVTLHH